MAIAVIGVQGMVVAEWRRELRGLAGCWGRRREGHEAGADRAPAATGDLGVLGAVFGADGDGRLLGGKC